MKPLPSKSSVTDRGNGTNESIKSIQEIGKAIGMSSWEIQEFTHICTKLRTLKIGKEILQDYQKLQQDIVKLNEKRRSYVTKIFQLFNQEKDNQEKMTLFITELSRYLMKLSEYSLKSWIAICRLRQLQGSPHPINISVVNGDQASFLVEYQSDAEQIIHQLQEHKILFPNQENWIYLMILLATSGHQQQEELQNFFKHNDQTQEGTFLSLDLHQFFLNLMKEIILQEIQCNQSAKDSHVQLSNADQHGLIQTPPQFTEVLPSGNKELFPILKICYHPATDSLDRGHDCLPSDEDVATTDLYIEGAKILLYYFYSHFTKNLKREVSDPHLVHSNNLAKINRDLITHRSSLASEKKQFLPLTGAAAAASVAGGSLVDLNPKKKNRPHSSPVISSKKIGKGKFGKGGSSKDLTAAPRLLVKDPRPTLGSELDNHGDYSEETDLNSLSHDDNGTYDLFRTAALGSPPIPEEPDSQRSLSQLTSDSQLRKEYEAIGVAYEPGSDVGSPPKDQVPSPNLLFSRL
jgi:hypothetical protein